MQVVPNLYELLLSTKEDILKNVGNQTFDGSHRRLQYGEKNTMKVNGDHQIFGYQHSSKYIQLSSTEHRNSYRFEMSWGWVNVYSIGILYSIGYKDVNAVVSRLLSSHRGSRAGERQTQEHEQRDELITAIHVRHAEWPVMAAESHLRRLEHIRQFQEVQWNHGGRHNG